MNPLVSILIPAFNAEAWIADTIASAAGQTWPRTEVIVVDDGSTDRTLEIARGFASETVSVVTQENRGGCVARNKAFSLCQGDYVQWLDADDILAADKVATQLDKGGIRSERPGLSTSAWGRFYYRVEKARFRPGPLWDDLTSRRWLLTALGGDHWMQPAAWLVSREVTERAGPWNESLRINQDGEYFCRVVAAGEQVRFVAGARSFYRRADLGCVSARRSPAVVRSFLDSLRLSTETLLAVDESEEAREACVRFLQHQSGKALLQDPESLAALDRMARDLDGRLVAPRESRGFSVARRLLGRPLARWAKRRYGRLDWAVRSNCDRLLWRLSGGSREHA